MSGTSNPLTWTEAEIAEAKRLRNADAMVTPIHTGTRARTDFCEVVTRPDGAVVKDCGGSPPQGLSVDDIIAILRVNPKAALEAVAKAKIAGPRVGDPPTYRTHRRVLHDMTATIGRVQTDSIMGGWWAPTSGRREPADDGIEMARLEDAALRAAGWILVDE